MRNDYKNKEISKFIFIFVILVIVIIMFGFFLPKSSFKSAYQQFLAPIFVAALTFSFQPKIDSVRKKIDDNEKEEKDLKKEINHKINEMYSNYYYKFDDDAEKVLKIGRYTSIGKKEFDFKTEPDGEKIETTVNDFDKTVKGLKTKILFINGQISGNVDIFGENLVKYCSKLQKDVNNIIDDIEFLNHNILPERRKGYGEDHTPKHIRCIFGRIKGLQTNVDEMKKSFKNAYHASMSD